MKKLLTAAALFFAVAAGAQFVGNGSFTGAKRTYLDDGAWVPREHNVDFIHMTLDVSFDVHAGLVKGKVIHRFTPLQKAVDSIWVDGPGIRILEASVNGKQVTYRTLDQGTWIKMPKTLTWNETDSMTLVYEANPRHGLYFVGWNDPAGICRKQVWSQGQGIDNRNWIPFYDEMNDKITTDMFVTFDSQYKVLSNGDKVEEKDNKDGTKRWHYRLSKPYAPYLVMLGIGIYDIKETKSKSGVPMHLYYYPDWKDRVDVTYQYSEQMIDFYESEIGVKYPWPSYSQIPVQEFMYGAMENVTATVYGDFLFVDDRSNWDRGYVGVNAHELAHQWFGDYVTAKSDAHHWLQESFATYYDQLFERSIWGDDHFNWQRREAENAALDEGKKNDLPIAHSQAGSARHYPKGAFVLNMLKYVVGSREAYNRGIKYYLDHHAYSNVTSDDLLNGFNESLGLSLNWFWEEWVYHGGEPSYDVDANDLTDNISGRHFTRFNVKQVQQRSDVVGLFRMPIWFEVHYADGTSDRVQQWIEKETEIVDIPNPSGKKISYVLFDPNNEVLKTVSFKKSFDWLKNQALNAPNMLDRYDALVALRDYPLEQKREVLKQVYAKETFQATKGEIVAQLINDTNPDSRSIIRSAINDKDVLMHRNVINNTTMVAADMEGDYEKLLSSPSYEVVMSTLDKLSGLFPDKAAKYLDMTKGVIGTSGRNVEVKWLEINARTTGDKASIDRLVALTNMSYEFRTRVNAAQALKRLDYFDESLMKNLVDASFSANTRLANPCDEVLLYFYNQDKNRKTIRDYAIGQTWKDWQKNILDGLLN
ncbi:MAG TPA: M1 family metallopeptidase [Bacteroidia bacterium]|nr:M1 family metallopeptidase [Bacteroidia bacterium]